MKKQTNIFPSLNTRKKGNVIVLITVLTIVLLSLIAFFVFNYNQIMGAHKQVQSATDAAALSAATSIGTIVVSSPLGPIALADSAPGTKSPLPVRGINTLMATVRLDAIISSNLGSQSMLYCVNNDWTNATAAAQSLAKAISASCNGTANAAVDKNGNAVDVLAAASSVYAGNAQNNVSAKSSGITLTPGYVVSSSVTSSTPTPLPKSPYDPATNGQTYYLPYQNYAVPGYGGATLQVQFVPLAANAALIENNTFQSTRPASAASYVPYTAIQVTTQQKVNPIARQPKSNAGTLNMTSTAVAGNGAGQILTPTGTLMISFASGGIPNASSVSAPLSFKSPVTIMNADSVNPSQTSNLSGMTSTPSNPGNWLGSAISDENNWASNEEAAYEKYQESAWMGGQSQNGGYSSVGANMSTGGAGSDYNGTGGWLSNDGVWFSASGGNVPGKGQLVPSANLGLQLSSPSVALAFDVYDWVKSLGLRPDIKSVVDAMNLQPYSNGFYDLKSQVMGGGGSFPIQISFDGTNKLVEGWQNQWIQPAYADQTSNASGQIGGLSNFSYGNPKGDPRNMLNWDNDPTGYQRQQSNVWGYVPANVLIPDNTRLVKVSDGAVTTTNGQPVSTLYDFWNALQTMGKLGDVTQMSAFKIITTKLKALDTADQNYMNLTSQISQLEQQIKQANNNGDSATADSLNSQKAQLNQQLAPIIKQNMTSALKQLPRAANALANAKYCVTVGQSMVQNMKSLTGQGVTEVSPTHFIVAGADFFPPTKAGTIASLSASGPVPTGQDPGAPNTDWCTASGGNNQSQLDFFKHASTPVIGKRASDGSGLIQPAYALSGSAANPYTNLRFAFVAEFVNGNTSLGTAKVKLYAGQDPFSAEPDLQGQSVYQNVHALSTGSNTSEATTVTTVNALNGTTVSTTVNTTTASIWQVQSRDQLSSSQSTASYFADMSSQTDGANTITPADWCAYSNSNTNQSSWKTPQCPALVSEWQLTCPQAVTTSSNNQLWIPPAYTFHTAINGQSGSQGSFNISTSCNNTGQFSQTTESVSYSGYYSGQAQFFVINGQYYYLASPSVGQTVGNGWSVTGSPYGGVTYSATATTTVDDTGS